MSDMQVKTVSIGPSSPVSPSEAHTAPVVDETPIDTPEAPEEVKDVIEEPKEPKEDEKDLRLSERFAALARQEERGRKDRLEIKEAQERVEEFNKLKEAVSTNPMAALEHLGIDLDALIMASLGDAAPQEEVDPISKLQGEFQAYKDQQIKEKEEAIAAEEQARQSELDSAVESHKQSITLELQDNTDKYELIHLNEAHDLVWEVTEAHYNEHGEVLTPSQAADLVEAHLDEKFQKILKTRKVREPAEEIEAPEETKKVISSHTLTSAMSSNTPQVQVSNKPMTMEESKRRAASLLKWTK